MGASFPAYAGTSGFSRTPRAIFPNRANPLRFSEGGEGYRPTPALKSCSFRFQPRKQSVSYLQNSFACACFRPFHGLYRVLYDATADNCHESIRFVNELAGVDRPVPQITKFGYLTVTNLRLAVLL